jgi:hypothetical protein
VAVTTVDVTLYGQAEDPASPWTTGADYFTGFMGAGNGWHTYDPVEDEGAFNVCNIGLEVSKDIVITDRFSIPVTGQLIFNPDSETMFLVVGFTL